MEKKQKGYMLIILGLAVLAYTLTLTYLSVTDESNEAATDFESCVAQGNPVMESYPRQCRDKAGNHFVEDIGDELESRI